MQAKAAYQFMINWTSIVTQLDLYGSKYSGYWTQHEPVIKIIKLQTVIQQAATGPTVPV